MTGAQHSDTTIDVALLPPGLFPERPERADRASDVFHRALHDEATGRPTAAATGPSSAAGVDDLVAPRRRNDGLPVIALLVGLGALGLAFAPDLDWAFAAAGAGGLLLGIIGLARHSAREALAVGAVGLSVAGLALGGVLALAPGTSASAGEPINAAPASADSTIDAVDPARNAPFGSMLQDDGLAFQITAPVAYTPSDSAVGLDGRPVVTITVTVTNGTDEAYRPRFTPQVLSGAGVGSLIRDADGGASGDPRPTMAADSVSTYRLAYAVDDPAQMTVRFAPTLESPLLQFGN